MLYTELTFFNGPLPADVVIAGPMLAGSFKIIEPGGHSEKYSKT